MKKPKRDHIAKKRPQDRRRRRKNPPASIPANTSGLFSDPIFMHHVAAVILRYLELIHPNSIAGMGDYDKAANFITPEEFDATRPKGPLPESPQCHWCERFTDNEGLVKDYCDLSPTEKHEWEARK